MDWCNLQKMPESEREEMSSNDDWVVEWPKHFKKLPEGYEVRFNGSHFQWFKDSEDLESLQGWDRYWVRRCAFAHHEAAILESRK